MSGVFIVIEALDGVGKTTLVHNLAARLGGVATDTPGPGLRRIRQDVLDALGDDQTARCLFYAATVLAQGRFARRMANEGQTVVMDRYWASTIAYARARGVTLDASAIEAAAPRPDIAVLLSLDEEERRRRLGRRGQVTVADAETFDDRFRAVVVAELRARCELEIDVTGVGEVEAVALVGAAVGAALTETVGRRAV